MKINNNYCIDAEQGLAQLGHEAVDLVITSPPYADIKQYDKFKGIHPDKYAEWILPIIKQIDNTLKPNGSFILNINDKVIDGFRDIYVLDLVVQIVKQTNLKLYERLFWNKLKGLPHRSRFSDRVEYIFWFSKNKPKLFIDEFRTPYSPISINRMKKPIKKRFARDLENQGLWEYKDWKPHPKGALPTTLVNISSESKRVSNKNFAVYPEALARYFIKGATEVGDLVVDPFLGSGTTSVVAKQLDRNYIGFDISQDYINDANERCNLIKYEK